MEEKYDFTKNVRNPYTKLLKVEVKMFVSKKVIEYFEKLSKENGPSVSTLMNFCLLDCVEKKRNPKSDWKENTFDDFK